MRSVLVVSGGGFQGQGLLDCLHDIPGVRPIVADIHADNVTRYLCPDYRVVPPLADASRFEAALLDLIVSDSVEAVFPATARELLPLARMRRAIEERGARLAVSSPDLLKQLEDKLATTHYLRTNGLPTQSPVDPRRYDFACPLFGRPRRGWGGLGTATAASCEEVDLHEAAAGPGSLLWTLHLREFQEFSCDFCVTESGAISPVVARRRIRTSGGFAVISESAADADVLSLADAAARLLSKSGAVGILNLQIIRPHGAEPILSDVNPRFGTSAVHGLHAGVNLAQQFLDAGNGAAAAAVRPAKTIRYLRTIAVPRVDPTPAAVVFDLDDTLVDHKEWMCRKVEAAYRAAASSWIEEDAFMLRALQLIDEGERRHLVDDIADAFGWGPERHGAFLEAYRAARIERTPLYPDVLPVLGALKDAGIELALLTDNPPGTQRNKILYADGLSALLSATIYARESGAEKPHESAFMAAAAALGRQPRELCMAGDNYFRDAVGALRAGYAHAFLIDRYGSFVRPHRGLAGRWRGGPLAYRIHRVEGLLALRETLLSARNGDPPGTPVPAVPLGSNP
jgi:FMN phosphatase YigB (HAD superfamily)